MTDDAPYDIKQKVEHPSLNPDLQTSGVKVVTITVSDLASLCAERDQAQSGLQSAVAAAYEDAQAALEEAEREARNEALREVEVNLKAYAPHPEDGPEHDVGYYHGYHTALNRILALMEDMDDE